MSGCLILLLALLGYLALDFVFSAGLIWIICWAFNLVWNWKAVIGVWVLLVLISGKFHTTVTKDE